MIAGTDGQRLVRNYHTLDLATPPPLTSAKMQRLGTGRIYPQPAIKIVFGKRA